jgi:hypothetical protein
MNAGSESYGTPDHILLSLASDNIDHFNMEAADAPETMVTAYPATRCHNLKYCVLNETSP